MQNYRKLGQSEKHLHHTHVLEGSSQSLDLSSFKNLYLDVKTLLFCQKLVERKVVQQNIGSDGLKYQTLYILFVKHLVQRSIYVYTTIKVCLFTKTSSEIA